MFKDLSEDNWEETLGKDAEIGSFYYSLRVVNHNANVYYAPDCPLCGVKKCEGCPLPYTNKSFEALAESYFVKPEDEEETKTESTYASTRTNSFYFVEKEKKFGMSYTMQSRADENKEKDLELEVFWDYKKMDVKELEGTLNKCSKQDKYADTIEEFKSLETVGVSLENCFERFRKPEQLAEDNTWYCGDCKEHV
jgi:hypothetical protein